MRHLDGVDDALAMDEAAVAGTPEKHSGPPTEIVGGPMGYRGGLS